MPLLFATPGEQVKVVNVGGNPDVKQHLNEIGFNVGSNVTVISKIPTGIIVKVKDARIAIDKSMAAKIMI